jgi:hypothetical protein
LDNVLVAVSQPGTSALISKKDFGGISVRVNVPGEPGGDMEIRPIPEPATFVLAGFAAIGVLVGFRVRRAGA